MRRRELLALVAAGLAAGAPRPVSAGALDRYRWDRRLVLVFAPLKTFPGLIVQRRRLSAAANGLAERDMTVVEAVQSTVLIDGQPSFEIRAETLRAEFGVSTVEFAVVLIGKDGGEKLRRDAAVTADELFATVDSMPMRQREMREREQKA